MPTQTTYTNARANLASLLEQVTSNREIVIINRRGGEDVALVSAAETRPPYSKPPTCSAPRRMRSACSRLCVGRDPGS